MPLIVKAGDMAAPPTGAIEINERTHVGARDIEIGETIYVWSAETSGGSGLLASGTVTRMRGDPSYPILEVEVDAVPNHPLTNAQLRPLRDSNDQGPLSSLAKSLYRFSHRRLYRLSQDEARLLAQHFNG